MENKQLKVIVIGAGSRGIIYSDIMFNFPEKFKVVGVAEPIDDRRNYLKEKHGIPEENCFTSWEDILAVPKFADIAIVATMDRMHTEPVLKALELGYDLLLEKPVAPTPEECGLISKKATECGRKIMVCHVLRYTPFFRTLKKLINDGLLGEVINIDHIEGVGNRHQSHSFVRGNWGNSERSTFMLLQKCCHDVDILQWLLDQDCEKVQSFGSTMHFRKENAPEGSPERCIDGCPASDTCPYDAMKLYYDNKGDYWFRCAATKTPRGSDTDCEVLKALKETQYGKCVYKCDNDVVDHQTVNMQFKNGALATLTMSAFNKGGRSLRIMGTKGELYAVMSKPAKEAFLFYDFADRKHRYLDIDYNATGDSIIDGHGGGDAGIVLDLYKYLANELEAKDVSEIGISTKNHLTVFAAEHSRLNGNVVDIDEYLEKYMN